MDETSTYWAALDADRLALRAMDKVRSYREWFAAVGHAEKALKGWTYANGWTNAGESSVRLQAGGEDQQLVKAVINGVRPLRQRIVSMVMSGAPEMQPVASNSDAAAREQADLSRGVLEDIHRKHRRGERDKKVLDLGVDMGAGALIIEWDARAGKVTETGMKMGPDDQPEVDERGFPVPEPIAWEGDFRYWLASAFDVYFDPGLRDRSDAVWVVARRWVSKWRLAAQYPEKRERILAAADASIGVGGAYDYFDARMLGISTSESDMVPEYVFWHLDTPELEGGRELRFLADGTWLADGTYPYDGDTLPVFVLTPDDVACTTLGYTNVFDVLGVSDAVNLIASGMTTNLAKGMVPPIINFAGSGLSRGVPIGTGHKVLNVSKPDLKPEYMEPPTSPPEAYKALEVLERWRLEGVGLNETSIGRPPYSGMAAQAMALLDSKVDEYNEGLQKARIRFQEATATFELRVLKRYASAPRIAQIAGKAKQWMAKSYKAEDLALVDAVRVEPVGAAARTVAGRLGLLETLSNFGVPLSPEQVIELFQTGQYESDFEAPLANRYRIREENELLMTGQMPPLLLARTHWMDIPEHLALLNSPSIVEKPEVVQAVTETVSAKLEMWRTMPPDLLALLGGPPPPPPPGMEMMQPGAPGEAPPPGGPAPKPSAGPAIEALTPEDEAAPALPPKAA